MTDWKIDDNLFDDIKSKSLKKLQEFIEFNDNYIQNYTNLVTPEKAKLMLDLGHKFGRPMNKLPIANIVKNTEYCVDSQPEKEEEKNELCDAKNRGKKQKGTN